MTASTVIFLTQELLTQEEAWVGGKKSKGLLKAWRVATKPGTGRGVRPLPGPGVLGSLLPSLR